MNLNQYRRFLKKHKKVDKFKSMKDSCVIFTENNARVSKDPQQLKDWHDWPNVMYSPSLSKVQGVQPHFWKPKKGKIVAMSTLERVVRAQEIDHFGLDNELKRLDDDPRFIRKDGPLLVRLLMRTNVFLVLFILGLITGSIGTYYAKKYDLVNYARKHLNWINGL